MGADGVGVYSGNRMVDYPTLLAEAARAARGLAEAGVGPGDRVALVLRNEPRFLTASIASAMIGASPVPLNWHSAAEEVGYILDDCGAKVVFLHEDLWPPLTDVLPERATVVTVPTPPEVAAAYQLDPTSIQPASRVRRYPDWIASLTPWQAPPPPSTGTVIYTSGTTGKPRGVLRDPTSDEARASLLPVVGRVLGSRPGARVVVPAPLYHTAPNFAALYAATIGLHLVLMPRFDAEDFLRIVAEHRISSAQLVPTMFVRLLRLPERVRAGYDLTSLEYVVHAAAPCPPDVKRAMIDWWGPIIHEYYGGTETGAITYCTTEEWLTHPGTVGKALDGATVAVLGADGHPLPAGEVGEVHMRMRSWSDFTYLGDPEKRASVERNGLISCGDVGYLDDDGFLYLCDRSSDMVISGGVNIYPAEIEACLLALDGVRDCAVFGIPDDEFGEALAAHVEADPAAELTADAVRRHIGDRMARFKVPTVVAFADSLPREDSGKIFKRRLREPYWVGRNRRI